LAASTLSNVKVRNFYNQDGARASFKKTLNRHNSATIQRIAVMFGAMSHFDPLKPSHDQNFDCLKIQSAGRPTF